MATDHIIVNTRLCQACWECVSVCSMGVIGKINYPFHKHIRIVNASNCVGCLACVRKCTEGAIMSRKEVTVRR